MSRKVDPVIFVLVLLLVLSSFSVLNVNATVDSGSASVSRPSIASTTESCSIGACTNGYTRPSPHYREIMNSDLLNSSDPFPSTLGISQTGSFELGGSEQRFIFFTQGRWWAFYNDFASPNHNVVFTSSTNGISWTQSTIIQSGINGGADYFGIGLAGKYFYYASNNHSGTYDYIQWFRGTPVSDGAITWGKSYNISLPVAPYNPTLTADTSNHPYISFNSADNNSYPYTIKSSFTNGTWQTAPGYPIKMDSNAMTSNSRRIRNCAAKFG